MVVLTGCSRFDVGGADYGRASEPPLGFAHQPATAQPPGAAGLARGTLSPGWERETAPREMESQEKRSQNLSPCSSSGSLTDICERVSKLASCTPTAKIMNFL